MAARVLPFLVLLFLLVGCAKPEAKYVGHYNGTMKISDKSREQINKMGPQAVQVLQQIEGLKFELDLKEDKTFTVVFKSGPANDTKSGTWTLADNVITLNGTDEKTPSKLTPQPDGSLVATNATDKESTITFTKA